VRHFFMPCLVLYVKYFKSLLQKLVMYKVKMDVGFLMNRKETVQVSDTTGGDSSYAAGYKKCFKTLLHYKALEITILQKNFIFHLPHCK
jgi:hypothetical protein